MMQTTRLTLTLLLATSLSNIAAASALGPPKVQVSRTVLTAQDENSLRSSLRAQDSPFLLSEPLAVEGKLGVVLSTGGNRRETIIPVVGSVQTSLASRMAVCRIASISSAGQIAFIERSETGFADDHEPCNGVRATSLLDVNADGISDLVYHTEMSNAHGQPDLVLDVYLVTEELSLCFSPKASAHLTAKYLKRWQQEPSRSVRRQIARDPMLMNSDCTETTPLR